MTPIWGGWLRPLPNMAGLEILLNYAMIWFRGTWPRFRYNQLTNVGWKRLIPIGMAMVVLNGAVGMLKGRQEGNPVEVAGTATRGTPMFREAVRLSRQDAPPEVPGKDGDLVEQRPQHLVPGK